MTGYKLGCPIPFEITAWKNTKIFLSLPSVHAHMLLGGKEHSHSNIDQTKATVLSFWNENFPSLHISHFPKLAIGKVFRPKSPPHFNEDAVLIAFLIKALLIDFKNQVGHPEVVNALLGSDFPYKKEIAVFFSGGVILSSANHLTLNRLHIPHGLSHAIILNDKLSLAFNRNGHADSLAFLLQGLYLSNFDFLKIANDLLHHKIEENSLVTDFPGLWLLSLQNGEQWWLAAHNNLELHNSIQYLNDHLVSIGEQRIKNTRILISDIDRDGIFRF